jgi:hypothetical protein
VGILRRSRADFIGAKDLSPLTVASIHDRRRFSPFVGFIDSLEYGFFLSRAVFQFLKGSVRQSFGHFASSQPVTGIKLKSDQNGFLSSADRMKGGFFVNADRVWI